LSRLRTHLTYANVMATIAVFIALGGGALAASGVISSNSQIRSCVGRHGNLTIVQRGKSCGRGKSLLVWNQQGARGRNGANGQKGAVGPKGDAGQNGAAGENGAPGTALAFAHVREDGTLDTANSKNVLDVRPTCSTECTTPPPQGPSAAQCFKLAIVPHGAVVSPEVLAGETAGRVQVPGILAQGLNAGCAPGYTAASVFMFTTKSGAASGGGFYVVFN
jgi:hypothetical protein